MEAKNGVVGEVSVIGAGTMGVGISITVAIQGYDVKVVTRPGDTTREQRAKKIIEKKLDRLASAGKITLAQKETALSKLSYTDGIGGVASSAIIIEAINEDIHQKKALFSQLDGVCPASSIICSNTSSIPIECLARSVARPGRFLGLHFMNPAYAVKLVEVIPSTKTDEPTMRMIDLFIRSIEKEPIRVTDGPGFVSNRLLMPMINEAVYCLMEEKAPAEDIDRIMKLGMSHPMGPLELADFIGLDICLNIMRTLEEKSDYATRPPCPLLVEKVTQGNLGRKTGSGFYTYQKRS